MILMRMNMKIKTRMEITKMTQMIPLKNKIKGFLNHHNRDNLISNNIKVQAIKIEVSFIIIFSQFSKRLYFIFAQIN